MNLLQSGIDMAEGYRLIEDNYRTACASLDVQTQAAGFSAYGFVSPLARGDFERGIGVLEAAVRYFRSSGKAAITQLFLMNQGCLYLFHGDVDAAEERLNQAECEGRLFRDSLLNTAIVTLKAMVALDRRDHGRAKFELSQLLPNAVPAQTQPWYYRAWVIVSLSEGDKGATHYYLGQMLDAAGRHGMSGVFGPECLLTASWVLLCEAELNEAESYSAQALEAATAGLMRFAAMKAHALLGHIHCLKGAVATATRHVEASLHLARRHNYWSVWRSDSQHFLHELLALGEPGSVPPDLAALPPRGAQKRLGPGRPRRGSSLPAVYLVTLGYTAAGWTRAQIAHATHLTLDAIKNHRSVISAALGGGPLDAILRRAVAAGLLVLRRHPKDDEGLELSAWREVLRGRHPAVKVETNVVTRRIRVVVWPA
jgi:hypothetical protein